MHTRFARFCLDATAIITTLLLARVAGAATPTDLGIRASVKSFKVGTTGRYAVSVSNGGGAATNDVVHVLDKLPNGMSFVAGSGTGWSCSSADGQSVDCIRATPLNAGTTSTFTLTVSVCTAAFPAVINTLKVVYAADINGSNNSVTKRTSVKSGRCIPPPTPTRVPGTPGPTRTPTATPSPTSTATPIPAATDLLLKNINSGTFRLGRNGTYVLTVLNVGPGATNTAFTVTDTLPAGLGFVSAGGAGWVCTADAQIVTCSNPTPLAAGASTSITLTVSVGRQAVPTVTNSATLFYPGDTRVANNRANKPTTVRR